MSRLGVKIYGLLANALAITATWTSAAIPVPAAPSALDIETTTTGTLTGTWTLETSRDGGSTFVTVAGASSGFTNPAGGATGPADNNLSFVPGQLYRVKFTYVSGSGNITVRVGSNDMV